MGTVWGMEYGRYVLEHSLNRSDSVEIRFAVHQVLLIQYAGVRQFVHSLSGGSCGHKNGTGFEDKGGC